jgi:hypothetical protein
MQTVSALGWQEAVTLGNRRSLYVAVVATLAALHIVLSLGPPFVGFRRLSIVMEPLEGIVAGPYLGFLAAAFGWIGGRFMRPDAFWIENFFGIAEAVGALGAGFVITRRWYFTAGIYGGALLAFLMHPLVRYIPLWTLWDTYLGFIAIFVAAVLVRRIQDGKFIVSRLAPAVAMVTFVAVELDAMVRIFMLIVVGLYQIYPIPIDAFPALFVAGAIQTPVEAAYSVTVATVVGVPVLIALEKGKILSWPLSWRVR